MKKELFEGYIYGKGKDECVRLGDPDKEMIVYLDAESQGVKVLVKNTEKGVVHELYLTAGEDKSTSEIFIGSVFKGKFIQV